MPGSPSSGTPQPRRVVARGARKGKGHDEEAGPSSKKERDPNWSKAEILSLIEAKRQEYLEEMSVDDPRELICPELGKWGKIAKILNASKGEGDVDRDRDACKYKWSTLLSDFKKIWGFHARTERNSQEYFTETTAEQKKVLKLPKAFYAVAYRNMSEWLKDKATMQPPHSRDTMNPDDGNYQAPIPDVEFGMEDMDSQGEPAWHRTIGRMIPPIELSDSESPAVSSHQSHDGTFAYGHAQGAGAAPNHTASVADLGRHRANFRSP